MISTLQALKSTLHVAIIMDGNGRWAESRGHARAVGHRAGGQAVQRTIEAAFDQGVRTLTLYAFSSDNWKRPQSETETLMMLFGRYLREQTARCVEAGVSMRVVGRRDRLDPSLIRQIEAAEEATKTCRELRLRLAIDYSARESLLEAARRFRSSLGDHETFERNIESAVHDDERTPDVDLLIRTGGEKRFSDLFGWDCAYAEVIFSDTMWPDFGAVELHDAIAEFHRRERRFGTVVPSPALIGPATLDPAAADARSSSARPLSLGRSWGRSRDFASGSSPLPQPDRR